MSEQHTRRGTRKMIWLAVASFGFAFAMVPMYNIACEKIFGVKLDNTAAAAPVKGAAVDEKRMVKVYFDGTVNSKLPWRFQPDQLSMTVMPGKVYEASYTALNVAPYANVGNATPSVAPNQFSAFFSKTECFCFTPQDFGPAQEREFTVRFIVDPDLPPQVDRMTLAYSMYTLPERKLAAR